MANDFFSTSGVKLKEAGPSVGMFVGEVAKDAKGNVTNVAEKVGSMVKIRWKGMSDSKDKVAVRKIIVEEATKKTAQKSKTFLTDIELW
ncbi:hypothetical protein LguiA_008000 [Lonicera macranthoides]